MDKEKLTALFEKYIQKLRITPAWDIKLEFVEDPSWPNIMIPQSRPLTKKLP